MCNEELDLLESQGGDALVISMTRHTADALIELARQRNELLAAAEYAASSFAQVPSDHTVPPIVLHDCREKLDAAIRRAKMEIC